MEHKYTASQWLNKAVAGLRFPPDRKAAEQELKDHIQDKTIALLDIFPDLSAKEAEQKAVDQMGDAEEIGRYLAALHPAWLGWLWRASQAVVVIALFFLFISLTAGRGMNTLGIVMDHIEESAQAREQNELIFGGTSEARLALYDFQEETRLGRSTLSVSQGALWREEDGNALYLQLRLTFDNPWYASRIPFLSLWAEDSLGNQYTRFPLLIHGSASGLGWQQHLLCLEDFPPEAQWVTFHYLPGVPLELTVDLTEAAP